MHLIYAYLLKKFAWKIFFSNHYTSDLTHLLFNFAFFPTLESSQFLGIFSYFFQQNGEGRIPDSIERQQASATWIRNLAGKFLLFVFVKFLLKQNDQARTCSQKFLKVRIFKEE